MRPATYKDTLHLLCYYENWARYERYWTGISGDLVNDEESDVFEQSLESFQRTQKWTLDPNVCTHIMYGFLYINPSSYEVEFGDPWADLGLDTHSGQYYGWNKSGVYNILEFKKRNKKLRMMGSVGGWNFNNCEFDCYGQGVKTAATFSEIAASEDLTRKFARNAKQFLLKYHFDGLDLDWEYPAVAGHNDCSSDEPTTQDRANYIKMIRRIKEEFQGTDLLVTAAVGVGINTAKTAYDIPAMANELDLISLMTYDIHGAWEHVLSFNSPLHATTQDTSRLCEMPNGDNEICMGGNAKVSTEWAVEYWLKQGVPANKLTVGVPTYGRGFTMEDGTCHTPGICAKDYTALELRGDPDCPEEKNEPVSPGASKSTGSGGPGFMAYYEIRERIDSGWKQGRSEDHGKMPYIYDEPTRQWIGYDDIVSIAEKMKFIKSKQVRGAMVWALSLDDTRGDFDGEPYPLLNAIRDGLNYKVCLGAECDGPVTPTDKPTARPTNPPVQPPFCCPTRCHTAGCGAPLITHKCLHHTGQCGISEQHCNPDFGGTDCTACATSGVPVCGAPTPEPTRPPTHLHIDCPDAILPIAPCMPSATHIPSRLRAHDSELSLPCPGDYTGAIDYKCINGLWSIVGGSCNAPTCDTFTSRRSCKSAVGCEWSQSESVCHAEEPDTDCSEFTTAKTCKLSGDCKWKRYKVIYNEKMCFDKSFKPAMPDCDFEEAASCQSWGARNVKGVCQWVDGECSVIKPTMYRKVQSS